jgi:hypothetical protein
MKIMYLLARTLSFYKHSKIKTAAEAGLQENYRYLPTAAHGVTTLKTNIDIFTAVKTSNLVHLTLKVQEINGICWTKYNSYVF